MLSMHMAQMDDLSSSSSSCLSTPSSSCLNTPSSSRPSTPSITSEREANASSGQCPTSPSLHFFLTTLFFTILSLLILFFSILFFIPSISNLMYDLPRPPSLSLHPPQHVGYEGHLFYVEPLAVLYLQTPHALKAFRSKVHGQKIRNSFPCTQLSLCKNLLMLFI